VRVPANSNLLQLLHKGSTRIKGKPGNCRQHNSDVGKMFGVGEMKIAAVDGLTMTKPTEVLGENNLLKQINLHSSKFAEKHLGSVLNSMKHLENQAGRIPLPIMGGITSPSCSMDVSCNLGNSSHYDIGDGSVGFSVWVELNPGKAENWYFILPNVLVNVSGITYHGIAIKLYHGLSIAWDGRVVRHATSITEVGNKTNGCFGWFWAADMKSAKMAMS
jgi:hypothetical protein